MEEHLKVSTHCLHLFCSPDGTHIHAYTRTYLRMCSLTFQTMFFQVYLVRRVPFLNLSRLATFEYVFVVLDPTRVMCYLPCKTDLHHFVHAFVLYGSSICFFWCMDKSCVAFVFIIPSGSALVV